MSQAICDLADEDCLCAPSALINLLLVSVMQEHCMCVHFDEDATIICFPADHSTLAGLSTNAAVLQHLSCLQCDFLIPPVPVMDGTEVTFPTF